MVCSAGGVQARIVPVRKKPVPPRWNTGLDAVEGLEGDGTCKGFVVELDPLRLGQICGLRECRDSVIARFVVILAD